MGACVPGIAFLTLGALGTGLALGALFALYALGALLPFFRQKLPIDGVGRGVACGGLQRHIAAAVLAYDVQGLVSRVGVIFPFGGELVHQLVQAVFGGDVGVLDFLQVFRVCDDVRQGPQVVGRGHGALDVAGLHEQGDVVIPQLAAVA